MQRQAQVCDLLQHPDLWSCATSSLAKSLALAEEPCTACSSRLGNHVKCNSLGKACGVTCMEAEAEHMVFAGSKLEAALLANAVKLSKNAAASLPATWNLVQVEFAATNFSTLSAAAAPSIHRFLQHSTSLPAQPALALIGIDSTEGILTDGPKPAEAQVMPATSISHPFTNSQSATTSGTAAAHQESACAGDARDGSDGTGCLVEPAAFADVDVGQQRQMLRDFEVRKSLSRHHSGQKRTQTGQDTKQAVKQSKLVHDTGQRTITSLFGKS